MPDVVLLTEFNDGGGEMRRKIVTNQDLDLISRKSTDVRKEDLVEPHVELLHVEPARPAGGIHSPFRTALTPDGVDSSSRTLIYHHRRQHVSRRCTAEHDAKGCLAVILHNLKILGSPSTEGILSCGVVLE